MTESTTSRLSMINDKIRKHGLIKSSERFLYRLVGLVIFSRFNLSYTITKLLRGSVVRNVNGFKMFLDLKNDAGISRDLFVYGKREHTSTDFLMSSGILVENSVALDIGANIGYYALIESSLVGKNGTVYAIEPVKKNYENLKRNISLNEIKNIETHNLAVGDKNGTTVINVGAKCNWSSIIDDDKKGFISKENVEMVTVDSFLEKRKTPSLIRMDVEGYEYAIIEGMVGTLRNNDITLLIEIHPTILTKEQIERMFYLLKQSGYDKAVAIFDPSLRTLNKKGEARFLSKFIKSKLNSSEDINPDKPVYLDIEGLKSLVLNKNRHVHAFIYKTGSKLDK